MARRRCLNDQRLQFGEQQTLHLIRPCARQQLRRDHTQRVDVTRCGDRHTTHLFRARVLRCEGQSATLGGRQLLESFGVAGETRNTKIEQLHTAICRDEDIARLEIACTTKFWCACCTAAHTCRSNAMRARRSRRCALA